MSKKKLYLSVHIFSLFTVYFCVYMWTVLQSARCVHVLKSSTALVVVSLKARSFYGKKGLCVCVCMCVILCAEIYFLT